MKRVWHTIEDGAVLAALELASTLLERRLRSEQPADRQRLLAEARKHLQFVLRNRPDTYFARHAQSLLDAKPPE